MNKGIWGQMMQLDLVVLQESRKERRTRKPQSSFQVWGESNNFPLFSYGWSEPKAGRHWITDLGTKRPCDTKESKSDWEHLLVFQPSSQVGSTATPFPLVAFLIGGRPEIYGSLHAHTLAETLGRKWGAKGNKNFGSGNLRAKTDLNSKKGRMVDGGVKT